MDEQVDLDAERKREILDLEARVGSTNLFEVLGLSAGATGDEVRTAFRELSRRFHPDRFYGKNLGSFRGRLEKIFRRLVEANQTLLDEARRKAYLEAHPFVRAAVKAATGEGSPSAVQAPRTELELAREEERRARFARHPYLMKASKVQEFTARAREAIGRKEYSQAFTHLNHATQAAPDNAEVKALLVEVRRLNDAARAETSFKHGQEALERFDEALALQAFKVAGSAGHGQAAFKASKLLDKLQGDLREATSFAQKAVAAEPTVIEYRMQLVSLLERAGMKALAKKELDEAAKVDPEHPEVKKQVKKRWPF